MLRNGRWRRIDDTKGRVQGAAGRNEGKGATERREGEGAGVQAETSREWKGSKGWFDA